MARAAAPGDASATRLSVFAGVGSFLVLSAGRPSDPAALQAISTARPYEPGHRSSTRAKRKIGSEHLRWTRRATSVRRSFLWRYQRLHRRPRRLCRQAHHQESSPLEIGDITTRGSPRMGGPKASSRISRGRESRRTHDGQLVKRSSLWLADRGLEKERTIALPLRRGVNAGIRMARALAQIDPERAEKTMAALPGQRLLRRPRSTILHSRWPRTGGTNVRRPPRVDHPEWLTRGAICGPLETRVA